MLQNKNRWLLKKKHIRTGLIILLLVILAVAGVVWYIYNDTYGDTAKEKAAFTLNAMDFIKEFQQNDSAANKKYAEQIVVINGRVSETEKADSTVNIKMTDPNGSYIIFAFQSQDAENTKQIKQGDSVSIKGSCSGGVYSDILNTEFITFKRCTINK